MWAGLVRTESPRKRRSRANGGSLEKKGGGAESRAGVCVTVCVREGESERADERREPHL